MSFNIQHQIKKNSTDIKSYIDDLYKWEEEISSKSKPLSSPSTISQIPQVRGQVKLESTNSGSKSSNNEKNIENDKTDKSKYKRDINSVEDYYKAWDNFDVDKELKKLETEEESKSKPTPIDVMKKIQAPANTRIVVKGGRNTNSDINSLRDRANLHYRNFEYPKALEIYSECIQKIEESQQKDETLYSLILSNRAMAYIKLNDYVKAKQDCDLSINYNPTLSKSYARRGICLKKMGKYKLALTDNKKGLELEPENIEFSKEITVIEEILKNRREKAAKNLIIPYQCSDKPMVKVNIEDKGSSEQVKEIKEEKNDYMQKALKMTFNVEETHTTLKTVNKKPENSKKTQNEQNSTDDQNIVGFLNLKEIDRIMKTTKTFANNDFDETMRKIVKFSGESDIVITNLKKKVYDPKIQPQKPIIKNFKKNKENQQDTIENVIKKGKQTIIGKILIESQENAKKHITSSQFLSHWKNIYNDEDAAMTYLQVIILLSIIKYFFVNFRH